MPRPTVNPIPRSLWFLALVLGVSFAVGLPAAASSHGLLPVALPPTVLFLVVLLSPALVAGGLAYRDGGASGLRRLLRPLGRWRVRARWYLLAMLLPVMVNAIALGAHALAGGTVPALPGRPAPEQQVVPVLVLPLTFVMFSLAEELGWRGYALPRLQHHATALTASLTIGAVWIAWHVPLKLTADSTQGAIPLGWYIASTLAISVVFTWLYNSSGGSLLPVVLLHASAQASTVALPVLPTATGATLTYTLTAVLHILVALVIIAAYGGRHLAAVARHWEPSAPKADREAAGTDRG